MRTKRLFNLIEKYKLRIEAVAKESAKRTIDMAQLSDDQGGRMRVDTGFLRNSGVAQLNGIPSGQSTPAYRGDPGASGEYVSVIAAYRMGDSIVFGWAANYARAREHYDGFRQNAVDQWSVTVNSVVSELKGRINVR
jgi:hypothetical protein